MPDTASPLKKPQGSSARALLEKEDGTTAVEYCIMLAMILMTIILSITAFGNTGATKWKNINNQLDSHGV